MTVDPGGRLYDLAWGIIGSVLAALLFGVFGWLRRLSADVRSIKRAQARDIVVGRGTHDILLVMVPPEHADEVRDIVRAANRQLEAIGNGPAE